MLSPRSKSIACLVMLLTLLGTLTYSTRPVSVYATTSISMDTELQPIDDPSWTWTDFGANVIGNAIGGAAAGVVYGAAAGTAACGVGAGPGALTGTVVGTVAGAIWGAGYYAGTQLWDAVVGEPQPTESLSLPAAALD